MIAYTVTKRAGDVETTVRVEVEESMPRQDRAAELAMAIDEAGIGEAEAEASEPAPELSAFGIAHSMIAMAVEAVPGVIFCVVTELDDLTEVWVHARPDARPAASQAAATAMSQYLTPTRRRVLRDVFGAAEIEAARVDTKPLRDRIRADREVFVEIESLTQGAPGNVQIANQLAKRAMAEVVPG